MKNKKLILCLVLACACAAINVASADEEIVIINPLIFTNPALALREGAIDDFMQVCDEVGGIINSSNSGGSMNMLCALGDGSRFQTEWSQDRYLSIEELVGPKTKSFKRFESIIPCAVKGGCDADFIVTRDEHELFKTRAQVISIKVQPKNRLGTGLHVDEKGTVQIIGR